MTKIKVDGYEINPNREEFTLIMQHNPPSEDEQVYLITYEYDINGNSQKILIPLEKSKFNFGSHGSIEILDINDVVDITEIRVRGTGNYAAYTFSFEGDVEKEYYDLIYKKDEKNLGVLNTEKTFFRIYIY